MNGIILHSLSDLTSFTQCSIFKVHQCYSIYQYSLYYWIVFQHMDIYTPHFCLSILFIHQLTDGLFLLIGSYEKRLLLAFIYNSLWDHIFLFSLERHISTALLCYMVYLCTGIKIFSKMALTLYIPISNLWGI